MYRTARPTNQLLKVVNLMVNVEVPFFNCEMIPTLERFVSFTTIRGDRGYTILSLIPLNSRVHTMELHYFRDESMYR